MTNDGFATLSAGIMARGTQRVRDILGDGEPPARMARSRDARGGFGREPGRLRAVRDPLADDRRPNDDDARINTARSAPAPHLPLVSWKSAPGVPRDVTLSVANPQPEAPGQPPLPARTSTTYSRARATRPDSRRPAPHDAQHAPALVDTPAYSGPDRRRRAVSPVVERRRSVPPRIKTSVRLEQERYLRLKLAAQQLSRTQQDILTSALDAYLDDLRIDRFVRIERR